MKTIEEKMLNLRRVCHEELELAKQESANANAKLMAKQNKAEKVLRLEGIWKALSRRKVSDGLCNVQGAEINLYPKTRDEILRELMLQDDPVFEKISKIYFYFPSHQIRTRFLSDEEANRLGDFNVSSLYRLYYRRMSESEYNFLLNTPVKTIIKDIRRGYRFSKDEEKGARK